MPSSRCRNPWPTTTGCIEQGRVNRYLQARTLYGPLIDGGPESHLSLVVVIPCYDEPDLLLALNSLWQCEPPAGGVEVIVLINESEADDPAVRARNQQTLEEAQAWAEARRRPGFRCFPLHVGSLSARQAGVGMARKIGLDEACRRLERVGRPRGILVFFDADSQCDPDFLTEVERYFQQRPDKQIASVYFEHPTSGKEFGPGVYRAVTFYELHLRYFVQAQRWAGFPHAVHTVGSSMAVRADAYQRQGGMNRRQAGEDFYFMHKFTPLGVHGNLTRTRVIPSPRPSARVPFGTGKDILRQLDSRTERETYSPQTFRDLKRFLDRVPELWTRQPDPNLWPETIGLFLEQEQWLDRLKEIRTHSASRDAFVKRFFRWFNAFQVMKFAHFARDRGHPDQPVTEAAAWLLGEKGIPVRDWEARTLLSAYRIMEREED